MNLNIDKENIEGSFDRIATDLLLQKALFVNGKEIRFTEIEFYYFDPVHQDNYTHKHRRELGEWRFHNQGLDITFQGDETSDGGILIRGIYVEGEYYNGPRIVVGKIFEFFSRVDTESNIVLKDTTERSCDILKTFRHIPNEVYPDFHKKHYRYLTDFNDLKIQNTIKELIKKDSEVL
jgi:hypothetical protein